MMSVVPEVDVSDAEQAFHSERLAQSPSTDRKPTSGRSTVPTTSHRSKARLNCSHEVSGTSAQLWHAARLHESGPWPPTSPSSMQTGSAEHQRAFRRARFNTGSRLPAFPILTSPPIVPSESPAAV